MRERILKKKMTEKQYKEYDKITEELKPVKGFLYWCGDRYREATKHKFHMFTKAKHFFLDKKIYSCWEDEDTIELPEDLQRRVVKTIEDWVEEKEQELEKI